jgi:Holliday junction resolvasome RuvABC endonuclease subunit
MTEFEKNQPEQLKLFLAKLNELVDEFYPNIYLMDEVFLAVNTINIVIEDELRKDKEI